jgi:hypothetical protein
MIWLFVVVAYLLLVIYIASAAMGLAMALILHVGFLLVMGIFGWLLWEIRKGDEPSDPPDHEHFR